MKYCSLQYIATLFCALLIRPVDQLLVLRPTFISMNCSVQFLSGRGGTRSAFDSVRGSLDLRHTDEQC
jgi:hypothetical protein